MEEQVQAESPAGSTRQTGPAQDAVPRVASEFVSPSQLREFVLANPDLAAYDRRVIDVVLGRAADTIDELVRRLKTSHDEVEQLRQVPRPGPEPDANQLLETVQQVVDNAKEEAVREAEKLRAEATAQAEESDRLHAEARRTLEEARASAVALLEEARSEHSRLVDESVGDVAGLRAELEADKERLEAQIAEVRGLWAHSLDSALVRIDAIRATIHESSAPTEASPAPPSIEERPASNGAEPEAAPWYEPAPAERHESAPAEPPSGPEQNGVPAHNPHDVIAELRHRLSAADGTDSSGPVR